MLKLIAYCFAPAIVCVFICWFLLMLGYLSFTLAKLTRYTEP